MATAALHDRPTPTDARTLAERLAKAGQEHLLAFHDRLAPEQQRSLLAQIASIDLDSLPALVREYVTSRPGAKTAAAIEPAPFYPADPASRVRPWNRQAYRAAGEQAIGAGQVAAFTVAGGQGSRLGFEGPKGCYPAGAVTRKPLFATLAEWILAAQRRYAPPAVAIPWYIMTSPLNHEPTIAFFRQNAFFGLRESDVMFFPQGVMPAFEMATGKVLLSAPHEVALSPDGHGGCIRAMAESGAIDDMKRRGVRHLSYTQIDNPLVRVIDPVFIGLHAGAPDSSGQMSSKMVSKAHPGEKVGVLCRVGGKTSVIEYSDMPTELTEQTNPDGTLRFSAGSIAIHVISVEFLERLASGAGGVSLPWHRAEKKVPCIDSATGGAIDPEKPNAVKLEKFVFDALALADSSIVVETDRTEEFAPIKNADGADSPATCSAIQTLRAARWLGAAGVSAPRRPDGSPDCTLEISPLRAMWAEDLRRGPLPDRISPGEKVSL